MLHKMCVKCLKFEKTGLENWKSVYMSPTRFLLTASNQRGLVLLLRNKKNETSKKYYFKTSKFQNKLYIIFFIF